MHRLLLGVLLVVPVAAWAGDHGVLGAKLIVKNLSTPDKRKVVVRAKEVASANAIIGNPAAHGATVMIRANGSASTTQTYNLPSGNSAITSKPFWVGNATKGYRYRDRHGENGPVNSASISKNKAGIFKIAISVTGANGAVNVIPPNVGSDGCALFTVNDGDSYSVEFASGTVTNDGSRLFEILGPTATGTCVPNPNGLPIDHVIVMMQENRSADNYLAQLSNQGQPDYEAEPLTGNPDPTNSLNPPILPFHQTNYCEVADLDHSWNGTHNEVNGGAMDGFTAANVDVNDPTGSRTMGYYDQTDLPFYYGLYNTFATGDRYFCSLLSQTFPNRAYLLAGTSFGHIRNDFVALPYPSIFNLLDQSALTWRIYASQYPVSYGSLFFSYVSARAGAHVFPMSQYFADLTNGDLPSVVFIDPDLIESPDVENDEHPPADVQLGQKFVADAINALMASSQWASSALFLAYDEHGGYYDHVVPPPAPIPDAIPPILEPGDVVAAFDQYGLRVPAVVVSPYSKAHFVSHVVHDHTSILRFIEYRFGLPSLTNRDANADPMLEFFDFNSATFATPPALPAAVIDPGQLAACAAL